MNQANKIQYNSQSLIQWKWKHLASIISSSSDSPWLSGSFMPSFEVRNWICERTHNYLPIVKKQVFGMSCQVVAYKLLGNTLAIIVETALKQSGLKKKSDLWWQPEQQHFLKNFKKLARRVALGKKDSSSQACEDVHI